MKFDRVPVYQLTFVSDIFLPEDDSFIVFQLTFEGGITTSFYNALSYKITVNSTKIHKHEDAVNLK